MHHLPKRTCRRASPEWAALCCTEENSRQPAKDRAQYLARASGVDMNCNRRPQKSSRLEYGVG